MSRKKIKHGFTTWNLITGKSTTFKTSAEFPKTVKKNLIKFRKKFDKDVEKISFSLPKNTVCIVEELEERENKQKSCQNEK